MHSFIFGQCGDVRSTCWLPRKYKSACSLIPPHCNLFTTSPHWSLLLCYFLQPPVSILVYTVKYAACDLIPYIPAQIRAVSVQDYPGNSCNAASPQLISLWMSGESGVILKPELPELHCIVPSHISHLLDAFGMQNARRGFFWLNGLLCIYHGHAAPVIGVRSRLSTVRRAAECKWLICNHRAIIMQSESRSSLSSRCCLEALMLQWGCGAGGTFRMRRR